MTADPFDLQRFVDAQRPAYDRALAELHAGRKETHWIWYILPQLAALGRSKMARHYGLRSLAEAQAYVAHPLLGARLHACVAAINGHAGTPASTILGPVDALKFRSSLTLFAAASPASDDFTQALTHFFEGERDGSTLALLADEVQARRQAPPG